MEQIIRMYARYERLNVDEIAMIPLEAFRGYENIVDGPYYVYGYDKDIK